MADHSQPNIELRKELLEEYKLLIARFDNLGNQAMTTKGAAFAAIAAGAAALSSTKSYGLITIIIDMALVCLWAIESYVRLNQFQNHHRILLLEKFFRREVDNLHPIQIAEASWEYLTKHTKIAHGPSEDSKPKQKLVERATLSGMRKFPVYIPYFPAIIVFTLFYCYMALLK